MTNVRSDACCVIASSAEPTADRASVAACLNEDVELAQPANTPTTPAATIAVATMRPLLGRCPELVITRELYSRVALGEQGFKERPNAAKHATRRFPDRFGLVPVLSQKDDYQHRYRQHDEDEKERDRDPICSGPSANTR